MIDFIKLITGKSRLDRLIKKADKLYKDTGKQYFIMPTKQVFDKNYEKGLVLVHGKTFLDNYNRTAKRIGKRQMTYVELINQCVYQTGEGTTKKRL